MSLFFKLTVSGADTVSDPMARMPGSQISIAKGTVDHIKSYREQLDQDGAQQSETECLLLSKIVNIASFSIYG